jgi:hypothetical protein
MEALTPRSAARSRLETFRQQQEQQRASQQGGGAPSRASQGLPGTTNLPLEEVRKSIPNLAIGAVSANAAVGNDPVSARPLSTRRLKKDVLCGDSKREENSNAAGHVQMTDSMGTPRSVRVVQQEALEDFNMVSVKWLWSVDNNTFQIELRHGRVSGIRKLYVNRQLIFRSKNISDLLADRGSRHAFEVGGNPAEVRIELGRGSGFRYHLSISGEEIERDMGISAPGLSGELGTRLVRVAARRAFGMTLANCGMRRDGVVVIDLEQGRPAAQAGLMVGDILLSVDEEQVLDTGVILDRLQAPPFPPPPAASHRSSLRPPPQNLNGEVTLEVAGSTPSRLVTVPNPFTGAKNGAITLHDTSCGIGVYASALEQWSSTMPPGTGRLEKGDVILSIDGAVTESAKETTKYMRAGPRLLAVVVAGRDTGAPVTTPR